MISQPGRNIEEGMKVNECRVVFYRKITQIMQRDTKKNSSCKIT